MNKDVSLNIKSKQQCDKIKEEYISNSISFCFEEIVKKYSQNIAIKTAVEEIAYGQLNKNANRVARYLIQNISQYKVALLFQHDIKMIIGILGTLKACKTYIPLDPTFPQVRIEYMIKDSESVVILTDSQNEPLAEELKNKMDINILTINIDAIGEDVSDENLEIHADPDSLAYILYTSGSTGNPKGVMQSHRNVLHFINCYTNNLNICETDKLTLLSTYSFDAAVMDIFGALLSGATLYPYDLKHGKNIYGLSTWIKDEGITVYHSTPTVYRCFIENLFNNEYVASIRLIVLGGEVVTRNDFEVYKKCFSNKCLFVNGLGPTESTVTLQYIADKDTIVENNSVPVGFPVQDTQVYIIDENGEEVEPFEIGELVYQSDYLALGYWKLEKKTQEVFKFNSKTGKRMYKSGDLGRALQDGSIEYKGRRDSQVKVRGYRIELEEVEAHINQYKNIKQSVVIMSEANENDKTLVAYYTSDENINVKNILEFLSARIPAYMIPTIFKRVDRFIQMPNGKTDRKRMLECVEIIPDNVTHMNEKCRELTDFQNSVFEVIVSNLADNLAPEIALDVDLNSIGLDSITFIKIVIALESRFEFEFEDEKLILSEFPTIKTLIDYVESMVEI